MASPHFKDGRYSKYLPARLASRFEESCRDERLLELRQDIALLDARIEDVLTKVDTGESGAIWKALCAAHDSIKDAGRRKDNKALARHIIEIGEIIRRGNDDARAWVEVVNLLEQRRKLVESERKRLLETQQSLTIEQALMIASMVVTVVRKHVTDRSKLAAISEELENFINIGDRPEA